MEIKMTQDIHIQGESDKSSPHFSRKQLKKEKDTCYQNCKINRGICYNFEES